MRKLSINGKTADLSKDTVIAPTFQGFTVDLVARRVSYTNEITLPFTQRNMALFENAERVETVTDTPYKSHSVDYSDSGQKMLNDYAGVLAGTSGDGYNVQIYGRVKDFFEAIKGKKLTQLNLGTSLITWNQSFMQTHKTIGTSSPVFCPFCNYGQINLLVPNLDIGNALPHVKFASILQQIITDAGYTYTGAIFSNPKYLRLSVPYSRDEFTFGAMNKFNFEASRSVPLSLNNISSAGAGTTITMPDTTRPDIWDGSQADVQGATGDTRTLKMDITLEIDFNIVSVAGDDLEIRIRTGSQKSSQAFNTVGNHVLKLDWVGEDVTAAETIKVTAHSSFGTTDIVVNSCKLYNKTQPVQFDTTEPKFLPQEILPDMDQADFVKEFAILFGVMFDTNGKELVCKTFNEVIRNVPTKDWTKKRDASVRDRQVFVLDRYAKVNRFVYDGDKERVNDGQFTIDNTALPDDQDYFVSGFRSSIDKTISDAGGHTITCLAVGDIKLNEVEYVTTPGADYTDKFENSPGLRICYIRDAVLTDPQVRYNSTLTSTYSIATWAGMEMQWFIDNYYTEIVERLQRISVVTRYYNLTPEDIADLSPFDIIRDGNQLYLVISCKEFIKGFRTQTQLFRL